MISTTGTLASTVGAKNPYRYRGYRYDTETGFYYLQSRYYDPEIGRFINADDVDYLGTSGTPLSYNLFTYCENDAVNGYDPSGEDAIWLQDTNSVYYAGHTGLLIQDSKGKWWHFYWGDNRPGKKRKSGTYASCVKLHAYSWKNLSSLNKYLNTHTYNNNGKKIKIYSGKYEASIYLRGNFSSSLNYAKSLTKKYNLIYNNCLQVSIDVLTRGTFRKNNKKYKSYLLCTRGLIVPNVAFASVASFNIGFRT